MKDVDVSTLDAFRFDRVASFLVVRRDIVASEGCSASKDFVKQRQVNRLFQTKNGRSKLFGPFAATPEASIQRSLHQASVFVPIVALVQFVQHIMVGWIPCRIAVPHLVPTFAVE